MTPEEKEATKFLRQLEREWAEVHRRYAAEDRNEVQKKLAPRKHTTHKETT